MIKLLIVDDNEDIVEILQISFEARGYEVIKLYSGQNFIENVKQDLPDLILLDIFLGGINGIDLCRELKANESLKDIPVIMLSAHGKKDDVLKESQADNFIPKPFDIYQLSDIVASYFGGEKGS
jgi:DNA-binding response OmpR family regulator